MDLSLNEEQRQLQDSVEKFVSKSYEFETRRKLIESDQDFSKETYQEMAELGWFGMPFSEDVGGYGFGHVETMVLLEQFGKGLVVEPYVTNVLLAGQILQSVGGQEERIAQIIEGKAQFAVAYFEEGSRYNLNDVLTSAKAQGDQYVVNGAKSVVHNAASADYIIVVARTSGERLDDKGISLILVEKDDAGLSVNGYKTFDAFGAGEVSLSDAKGVLLGEEGEGLAHLQAAANIATFGLCAEAVGAMEVLYKDTVAYSKERKQFGVPIGSFQALQHRMVDMFMAYEQTKSLLYMASIRLAEGGVEAEKAVSALKAQVGKAGRLIGQEAVQIHGGMGVTDELHISHYFRRLTSINLQFGDASTHLKRFAALS